jgi:hypothetical protein
MRFKIGELCGENLGFRLYGLRPCKLVNLQRISSINLPFSGPPKFKEKN